MKTLNPKLVDIIKNGSRDERLYIFSKKPIYYAIYYFTDYFTYKIPQFHYDFYNDMEKLDNGELNAAAWIAFRESAKTSLAKIFVQWLISFNKRHYINYDSFDKNNSESALFDIILSLQTNEKLKADFGELYNEDTKKEKKLKRIKSFITSNGIKVEAFSTGQSVRGRVYKQYRPDALIFDDIETMKTKDSPVYTQNIIDHIDEARTGIAPNGFILYLGNLITENGVIDYVMRSLENRNDAVVRNIPVIKYKKISWPSKYVLTDKEAAEINKTIKEKDRKVISIERKRRDLGNAVFEREMMNNPFTQEDLVFNRQLLADKLKLCKEPIKVVGDIKLWDNYNPKHRYGLGGDTAEGIGGDHSTMSLIDFSSKPARLIATYKNNQIAPDVFAYQIKKLGEMFGECIVAPEINNTGYATIAELQNIYSNIYMREEKDKATNKLQKRYGFRTTGANKSEIVYQLKSAVEDGELVIYDEDALNEIMKYKKSDLRQLKKIDGMTNHFDLLMSTALAWEMRYQAEVKIPAERYNPPPYQPISEYELP